MYLITQQSQTVYDTLTGLGEEVYLKKDTIIDSTNEKEGGLYYVLEGKILCKKCSFSGREKIDFILGSGNIFLEGGLFNEEPTFSFYHIVEDSHLIYLAKDKLLQLMKDDLDVTLFIMESLSKKLQSSLMQIEEAVFYDTEWRICNLLLNFAQTIGEQQEQKIKLKLRMTHQFISDLLGVNRVTGVRILKKLKEMKLIEQSRHYFYITDPEGLKKYQKQLRY